MTPKEYLKQTDTMKKHINSLEVDLEEMRAFQQFDMMRNVLTMGQGILKHLSFEVLSGLQIWSQRLKMQNMLCCP